jgi:hypothetical protein
MFWDVLRMFWDVLECFYIDINLICSAQRSFNNLKRKEIIDFKVFHFTSISSETRTFYFL